MNADERRLEKKKKPGFRHPAARKEEDSISSRKLRKIPRRPPSARPHGAGRHRMIKIMLITAQKLP